MSERPIVRGGVLPRQPAAVSQDAANAQPLADPTAELVAAPTFPEISRLELDELLTQLIDRAQEVMTTQSRLRGLLSATQAISSDLSPLSCFGGSLNQRVIWLAPGTAPSASSATEVVSKNSSP